MDGQPGAATIPRRRDQPAAPRLLVLECEGGPTARRAAEGSGNGPPSCMIVASLEELRRVDLTHHDIVVCAGTLPEGAVTETIRHVAAVRPGMPVIVLGRAVGGEAPQDARGNGLGLLMELAVSPDRLQGLVRRLEALARTDALTGLCNRRWLEEMLGRLWDESLRLGSALSCLMVDLDGFKLINDRLGHQGGDEALRGAAGLLRDNCRRIDVVARYGGDEFCVLMPDCTAADAARAARRIVCRFEAAAPPGISIGVASGGLSHPSGSKELLRHADEALYTAKFAGRGCVMVRTAQGCVPAADLAN